MIITKEVASLLHMQYALYPHLTVQDMVKALYQAEFGCGHFISSEKRVMKMLTQELLCVASPAPRAPFVEPVGSEFCRIHLSRLREKGLSLQTLARLFILSAQKSGNIDNFHQLLSEMLVLIDRGDFATVESERARHFLADYCEQGCPSLHHSPAFRESYTPAYRVIRADFARYLPLLCAIDQALLEKKRVTVAIEGGSASGKTTLGELLSKLYDCNLFHTDDFFLQPHQRTPERFEEVGGNVDYERFKVEVLDALETGKPFSYRVFDCSQMELGAQIDVSPKQLNIVEGAYSMHPYFGDVYDLSAFIHVGADAQKIRILERNGKTMFHRFVDEWIPLEEKYFEGTRVSEKCTFVL